MTPTSAFSESEIGRRAMALHEAGHQVMAVALSVRSKGVVLLGDAGRSFDGLSRSRFDPCESRYWELLEKEIQILLAGECAVRLFYDSICDGSDAYGSEADRFELGDLFSELSAHREMPAYMLEAQHENKVLQCLEERWSFVDRLANELLHRGKLSGDEVMQMLPEMPGC